ncbi:hypothetical protein [uncultured Bradyrhizobium sp.]|nr:hypothetical protein [uncultured Bradyrhizobium sp.]
MTHWPDVIALGDRDGMRAMAAAVCCGSFGCAAFGGDAHRHQGKSMT